MGKITSLTKEEVAYFAKSPSQHIKEALQKAGLTELAAEFEKYASMRRGGDLGLRTWISLAMSELYRNEGAEPVEAVLMDFFGPIYKSAGDFWEMNFRDRVIFAINNIRDSLDSAVVVVDEDEEKLRFTMNPCTTGQLLREAGIYEGERACSKCSPHRITGGRDEFPIYCTHNPIMDMACIDACGYTNSVTEYPDDMCSCACTYVVYKNKDDVPEFYYTRIGREKPKA